MNDCPEIPVHGFLDLHCHFLPGIDDGCRDLEMSLECIRLWQAAGFVGAVCTPHLATTWFPENTPAKVAIWTASLRAELATAKIEFQLWAGGEVRLSNKVVSWWEEHGVPTLGPGRCVLIDWWATDWPDYCDAACQYLLDRNYQPILAHPERMGLPTQELFAVVHDLRSRGVWLQGNLNSISGGEGTDAADYSARWLKEEAYHLLASDTHEPLTVPSRIAGLEKTKQLQGSEVLQRLLADRPREVMRHGLGTNEGRMSNDERSPQPA